MFQTSRLCASVGAAFLLLANVSTLAIAAGGAGGGAVTDTGGVTGGNGGQGGSADTAGTAGGNSTNGQTGGAGGAAGNAGGSVTDAGGGGGGGGISGFIGPTLTNTTNLTGGTGGAGGNAQYLGGGGGGGQGGYGASVSGAVINDNHTIAGGAGGAGGITSGFGVNFFGAGSAGNGGDGGIGVNITASGSTLSNVSGSIAGGVGGAGGIIQSLADTGAASGSGGAGGIGVSGSNLTINNTNGSITGGNGGAAGVVGAGGGGAGTAGIGGIGVVGSGLTITNTGGTITGGTSGDGLTQAFAIQFTGGTNSVGTGGTISGGINVLAGSFQPAINGSAVGTALIVNGPLTFAAGSFYTIRITPTATDSVTATGAATVGGASVNVAAGAGTYTTRRYTILTATGGVTGTFSGVTSNLAFLTPALTYDASDVYLNVTGNAATAANPAAVNYRTAAVTQNQLSVASGLTNASQLNGGTGPILTAFNQLTAGQAQAAFNSVSGEGITAAQNAASRSSQFFDTVIFDEMLLYGSSGSSNSITLTAPPSGALGYAPQASDFSAYSPIKVHDPAPAYEPQRTWRAWASGFGGNDNIHGDSAGAGSAGQNNTIYGGTLGVDYQLMPNYLAGVAVGGSDAEFSVASRSTYGSTTGGHIAFYSLATFGSFYGASSTSASFFTNRATRLTGGFGGLANETDRGSFDSHEFRSRLEFGRHVALYGAILTPFVALELAELRSNGFNETAVTGPGLLALNVSGQSSASVPAFLGLRLQQVMQLGGGMVFTPNIQTAYVHEFAPQRNEIAGLINLPGSAFLANGARPSREAAQVKSGFELALDSHSAFFVNFDGEFSGKNEFYGGKGGFKYVW